MIRKLGAPVLVAMATTALWAMAGTVDAAQFTTDGSWEEETVSASQFELEPNGFTLAKAAAFRCKQVTYHGTMNGTEATLTPNYESCEMYKEAATISGFELLEGATPCDWHLYITAKVDIKCAAGKDVEIHTKLCTITIKPQAGLSKITWAPVAGFTDFDVTWALEKLQYEYIGGFGCELQSGVKVGQLFADGRYEGKMTYLGKDSTTGKQNKLSLDP
jgi:hypothetical protein